MLSRHERILVVEGDPDACDLIARQALSPMGYQVRVARTAGEAIQQVLVFSPDLIVTSLILPDLSGKDLLVALSSQGLEIPVIAISEQGLQNEVIQAFRLGATDFLGQPLREAELVAAVERALKQVRARREREDLARQLKKTNEELQRRVRELTTIFAIGKAVTSITDQAILFDRIVEGAVYITDAQSGWLLIRDETSKAFILRAHRNLPRPLEMKLNQPWDDGISSLVALSGEPLSIHGEPLKRFKIHQLGEAALVVPVKIRKETIGLMVVVRQASSPFNSSDQAMLEAVADYASISLVNARLFRALEERAQSLQKAMEHSRLSEKRKDEMIEQLASDLQQPLVEAQGYVAMLASGQMGELAEQQREAIQAAEKNLYRLVKIVDRLGKLDHPSPVSKLAPTNLNDLARQAVSRFQPTAQQVGQSLVVELPANPVVAFADSRKIGQVFDGLLSNALKFSPRGSRITVRVERMGDGAAHVTIKDTGIGIHHSQLGQIFDADGPLNRESPTPILENGAKLVQVKEIVTAHGGRVWAESWPGEGSAFHFTLLSPH